MAWRLNMTKVGGWSSRTVVVPACHPILGKIHFYTFLSTISVTPQALLGQDFDETALDFLSQQAATSLELWEAKIQNGEICSYFSYSILVNTFYGWRFFCFFQLLFVHGVDRSHSLSQVAFPVGSQGLMGLATGESGPAAIHLAICARQIFGGGETPRIKKLVTWFVTQLFYKKRKTNNNWGPR